jgi:hypothetical protein
MVWVIMAQISLSDLFYCSRGMGNFFIGQIGGLAVFNRALNDKEINILYLEFANPIK